MSRAVQPKIVDVRPRPANTTATCGPCSKLARATQSKHIVRVGFTYMRGEDEFADVCEEHLAELRKIINQPGLFPPHWRDDVWRE